MVPDTMRVVELQGFGGPEVLRIAERAIPQIAPDEVLIRVAAAGFNRADVSQREGRYPPPPGESDLPGLECSGLVVATGDRTTRLHIGDRVCALLAGGGYAEFVAVPEEQVLPAPESLDLVDAAGIMEVAATVLSNLAPGGEESLPLPGSAVLFHGGSGGLGGFGIQLGAALGLTVYATAGTAAGVQHCLELGAAAACNYRERDFAEFISEETRGIGVDFILDMVGASYLMRNLRSLSAEGRLAIIATLSGSEASLDLRLLMQKRLTVQGTTLRARPVRGAQSKAEVVAAVERVVWPLVSSARLKPVAPLRMPLDRADDLHAMHAERSLPPGKAVLVADPTLA